LQDRGIVKRQGKANYTIDFDGVKRSMKEVGQGLKDELEDFQKVYAETEQYMREIAKESKVPVVTFLEYNAFYKKVINLLRYMDTYYITGIYPRMLYPHSPSLAHEPGARDYSNELWKKCMQSGEVHVVYLTTLNLEYLFGKLLKAYKKPRIAYKEASNIIDNIELADTTDKLDIYYTEKAYGVDMAVPESKEGLDEFFITIRGTDNRGIGLVHIKSSQLTPRFREIFRHECQRGILLEGKNIDKVVRKKKKELKELYKKYKSEK
jgi:hypothetical protein